ncbi:MAG: serine hydrolase [Hyphomicrobium sp.]
MLRRNLVYASAFAVISGLAVTNAGAGEKRHAAFILDANTGAVLHNEDADEPRHPASLTKMMTLYLTFETLNSGRLKMSDKLTISTRAASVAPSRLDLDPGDQISVSDAIRAVITKSANDIAVALAEKIGGSEPNFARLMNVRARQLGMSGTHYENASGLPNDDQITTARDMATLALHLQDDFPQYYPLFATQVFSYGGKSYRNHNTMLKSFAGIDGIKTGYTRASGFNLVTSWHRGSRHLIGVVFGGSTAGVRNAEMRVLLTRMASRASSVKTRRSLVVAKLKDEPKLAHRPEKRGKPVEVAETVSPPPPFERTEEGPSSTDPSEPPVHIFKVRAVPVVLKAPAQAPSPDDTTDMQDNEDASDPGPAPRQARVAPTVPPHPRAAGPLRAFAPTNLTSRRANSPNTASIDRDDAPARPVMASLDSHPAPIMRGTPPSTLGAQARALAPARHEELESRRNAGRAAAGRYQVQIGAYGSIDDAQRALSSAQDRAPRLLAGVSSVTNPAVKDGHQIFRARFTGLDANRAASTCNALRRQSLDCFVMAGD